MIKEWIAEYNPQNEEEIVAALREIMQEITLAGLSRTDFFEKATFYGGTSLRIFYGLDRYSEDLDFSLLKPDPNFSIEPYFKAILDEFKALGLTVSIKEKTKSKQTAVDSAYLKAETIWQEIVLEDIIKETGVRSNKTLKIKIEVDRQPPLNFKTEQKLLLRPFSFYVKCFTKPSLFAGKMHALLFRKWKDRVKGRLLNILITFLGNQSFFIEGTYQVDFISFGFLKTIKPFWLINLLSSITNSLFKNRNLLNLKYCMSLFLMKLHQS